MSSVAGVVPEGFAVQSEGKAIVLFREGEKEVFYNPAQVANRDLSIAMIRWYIQKREEEARNGTGPKSLKQRSGKGGKGGPKAEDGAGASAEAGPSSSAPAAPKGLRVLEAMAASGLRSIRYAKEIEGLGRIDCNDLDEKAVENIRRNVAYNGGRPAELIQPIQGDCRLTMYQRPLTYDVIDLDPYGSPSQLLDSTVQAAVDGGLLCVTATDMSVLCGNNGEVCFTKYGCYPLHKSYCHEQAIRIVLACLENHAARYKRYIQPVLSLSIDFYVRVFVRIYTSAQESKKSATRLSYLFQSQGCDSFQLQPVGAMLQKEKSIKFMPGYGPAVPQACPETGSRFTMGGPIWSEPIHDYAALEELKALLKGDPTAFPAYTKIFGLVTSAAEELPDCPLYFDVHSISGLLKCVAPKTELVKSALINAGYRISDSHASPTGVKTDAPWSVIWDVMRCWVKDHPVKLQSPDTPVGRLLSKPPQLEANWARAQGAVSNAKMSGVTRFWTNPANWGPKAAVGSAVHPTLKRKKDEAADEGAGVAADEKKARGNADGMGAGADTEAAVAQP